MLCPFPGRLSAVDGQGLRSVRLQVSKRHDWPWGRAGAFRDVVTVEHTPAVARLAGPKGSAAPTGNPLAGSLSAPSHFRGVGPLWGPPLRQVDSTR